MSGMESVQIRVSSATSEAVLVDAPNAFRTGSTEVMLAALARAVRGYQRDNQIADDRPIFIQVERHGREDSAVTHSGGRADLTRTVGWFTTIAPVRVDPAVDAVHAVKAAKEELAGQPDLGAGFGALRFGSDSELSRRPLPSIGFNFLGAGGGSQRDEAPVDLTDVLLPVSDAPDLPPTVSGRMRPLNTLLVNVGTVVGSAGRELVATFFYDNGVLNADDVDDLARRWIAELDDIVAAVGDGDVGLSPSDIPGGSLTQADLDGLALRYPGAMVWPLTPLQRGFYFQHELVDGDRGEGIDVYVAHAVLTLDGDVDVDRLRLAAAGVLDRHEVLRSGYVHVADGAPVAVVPPRVEPRFTVVDLRGLPADEV
ncbi:MAG: hypothetical protein EKK60_08830, partial [Gordonia sp. (in: high G+C Gram-positive bacteria)]